MVALQELVQYADGLLRAGEFVDYCPNGLQVEGRSEVRRLIAGVTASQALVDAAALTGADALLVHHGYFWKGESHPVTGIKRRRLGALLQAQMSLLAYHLPLDAHPELGNNAQLGMRLRIDMAGRCGPPPLELVAHGRLSEPLTPAGMAARIEQAVGRVPLHVGEGPEHIRTVGWCTGAAQGFIEHAVAAGLDAYISGEISEQTVHIAREAGIHYFAAGHHATERGGADALGRHLAERFGLEYRFIDIDNPV